MGDIRDYRDLIVWQKAVDLAVLCEEICDTLGSRQAHTALQLRKSAGSVHLNIAEGNGRPSRAEYLRFLGVANGSLRETEANLHFLRRRVGPSKRIQEALDLCTTVFRLLSALIRSLRGKA